MTLYHVTSGSKLNAYRQAGMIRKPVRGYSTLLAAMAWAMSVERQIIIKVEGSAKKMPDHGNKWGDAFWIGSDVTQFEVIFDARWKYYNDYC